MDRRTRIAGIAALDQPVRADLYAVLADRDGWVGRDEAAEAAGVPRSVAAFHLDKLVEAGLVETRFERPPGRTGPGAGRPAKKYRRAEAEVAVSLPDRRYDLAGALLADAVAESEQNGRPVAAALANAAKATGRELGASLRSTPTIEALEQLGYEPHEREGDVVLANCPFHALAERHRTLVCGMNLDLLTGLTEGLESDEAMVPRLEPAEGMCCVRLRGSTRGLADQR